MYFAGLSAAMQYVAVEQTTIDRVISFLRENSEGDWARQFAADAAIALPSLGRGDRAQELGLHHDRAQQVMAETVQGIVVDLEAFADSVHAAARLIRRAEDRGSFVILSAAMPSRLLSAFPPGTPVRRLTLDEAIIAVSRSARSETLGERAAIGHQGHESGLPRQE